MQTFLPFPSFAESAAALDYKRLGKQRVECKQILQALRKGKYTCKHCKYSYNEPYAPSNCTINGIHVWQPTPWYNHPAVKMWRGYEQKLIDYSIFICEEWISRGYNDNLLPYFQGIRTTPCADPPWLGNPDFHRSHQSNLIRKDPAYYSAKFPGVPADLPYIWPV